MAGCPILSFFLFICHCSICSYCFYISLWGLFLRRLFLHRRILHRFFPSRNILRWSFPIWNIQNWFLQSRLFQFRQTLFWSSRNWSAVGRNLIDDILTVTQTAPLVSIPMPFQIPGGFQFLQPGQDTIFALFGDGSKPTDRVVPVLRKTQEHRKDSFGFEGNGVVSEVVIAHGGIVGVLFYTENRDRQHLLPTQRQSGIYADSRMRLARRINRSLPLGVIRVWWAICPYP